MILDNKTRWKLWHDNRVKEGWKRVQAFVPLELASQIKELCRRWKFENPSQYKKG